ncbi:MAG: hypothetical protein ACUVWR_13705, partial [Anaerolineae bacterium]
LGLSSPSSPIPRRKKERFLSTGDQVPGDTPEANFVALIESARQYGNYTAEGDLPDCIMPDALK